MTRNLFFIIMALLVGACDKMAEHERLIYEKPEPAQRVVLLEDFTGQRCVNCPTATEVIAQLQGEFGSEAVVAVAIHGGPLGFSGSATVTGLATEVGDMYFQHWNLEYQPVGMVNRRGAKAYSEWTAAVREELTHPSPLKLTGKAVMEGEDMAIEVNAFGTDGSTHGKLQLWVTEDSITALQMMPDGTANREYVHNHVFRTAVNGNWGEDFAIGEGEDVAFHYHQPLLPEWDIDHLSIIAFVYNEGGVLQVVKIKVESKV